MMKKYLTTKDTKTQEKYNVWKQYNKFIRELYLEESIKKETGREIIYKFLNKLIIVFFGSLLTTLTFYFLIDPNGIYNSGLNGLLQTFAKLTVGYDKVRWENYYLLYYGLGLVINVFFIFLLWSFFKAKLEVICTSIFYVLFQIFWVQLFKFFDLSKHVFNRFNPASWRGLSGQSQLSFTLPYYIVIAIVAAIIHTYGYSLIFQAQATPGGLEIFTSHFSSQKKSISISTFMKLFGGIVILIITLVNFIWIEDNIKIKESILKKEIIESLEKTKKRNKKQIIKKLEEEGGGVKKIIECWTKDMEKANNLQGKEKLRIREDNLWISSLLKTKTNEPLLEKYPQEAQYYLMKNQEIIESLEKEIGEINKKLKNSQEKIMSKQLERKRNLESRKEKLKEEEGRNIIEKYLSYVTNNERLWATLVYVFLSSFLISQIFPRDQMVLLCVYLSNREKLNKGLKLLKNFSPIYYTVYQKKNEEDEVTYTINCYLSKWNYYLFSPYLKKLGKFYANEANRN